MHYTPATPEALSALLARCAGRSGGAEAETTVRRSAAEVADGYVTVVSTRPSDVAAILRRCGSAVVESGWEIHPDRPEYLAVELRIREDVFRGPEYAFRPVDVESRPMSPEAAARLRGGA